MAGSVVTFYSYKGGVGRSFALANVGVLLSRWGFRVLCIDFDLEAPGLSHFFGSVAQDDQTRDWLGEGPGLVELIARYRREPGAPLAWRDHVHRSDVLLQGAICAIIHPTPISSVGSQ
ncbi:hypothetical protein [Mesorhizobium abyssinicae]|uniref:nucleotide-binding protein n=1 Tax=Mesorhizobium abyssinicae TaxID=1209958 RepID=UPI00339AEBDD